MHVLYLDWFSGIVEDMIVRAFLENSAARKANFNRAVVLRREDEFQLRPGNYASPSAALAAIAHSESVPVIGYFEEAKLRYIRIGDPLSIQVMGEMTKMCDHVEGLEAGILQFSR
jgi:hypothetical protein